MARLTRMTLAAAVLLTAAALTRAADPAEKFQGVWVRRGEDCKIVLEIQPDGLTCTVATANGMAITVEADYVVSGDGIMVGVIRPFRKPRTEDERDNTRERIFCLRLSATEKTLTIKDAECANDRVAELAEGTYHRTERPVDLKFTPGGKAKVKKATCYGACVGAVSGAALGNSSMTLPSDRYLEHPPQYLPAAVAQPEEAKSDKAADAMNVLWGILESWGVLTNSYSSDPHERIRELINENEVFEQIGGPVKPVKTRGCDRVRGGIGP